MPLIFEKKILLALSEAAARLLNWLFVFSLIFFVGPHEYGILSVIISLELMVSSLFIGGFSAAILRFLSDPNESCTFPRIFYYWLIYLTFMLAVIGMSALIFSWQKSYYLSDHFFLFLLAMIVIALAKIISSAARAQNNLTAFTLARLIPCLLRFSVIFIFLFEDKNIIQSYFWGYLASCFPVVIAGKILMSSQRSEGFFSPVVNDRHKGKRLFFYALPFLPHVLMSAVIAGIDRIMLNDMLDAQSAGYYHFAFMLGSSISFVFSIISLNYERDLYSVANDKHLVDLHQKNYFLLLHQLSYWVLSALCCFWIIASLYNFIPVLNQEIFAAVIVVFAAFMVHIYYLKAYYYLTIAHKTSSIAIYTSVGVLINVVVNYLLIPQWGIVGAAVATLITKLLLSAGVFWRVKKFGLVTYKLEHDLIHLSKVMIIIPLAMAGPYYVIGYSLLVCLVCFKKTKSLMVFHLSEANESLK